MNKKKKFYVSAAVLALLAVLVFLQVKAWRKFDWHRFWAQTKRARIEYVLAGAALVYGDYILRAVRWKILLRPVCEAKTSDLVAPTMIGFTGLALLGRPGELIRPYLIARKVNLSMASQVAVWAVERIFDMGAFALIMAVNILWSASQLEQLPGFANGPAKSIAGRSYSSFYIFEASGLAMLALVAVIAWMAFIIRRNPEAAARVTERALEGISPRFAKAVCHRIQAFGEGLNTIKDLKSFIQVSGLSVVIWLVIGLAYLAVTHAYRIRSITVSQRLTFSTVLLLTAASVAGGVLQLPVVGGGSQLATIGVLHKIFGLSPELSTSCGIMLWLVTFMSVIPSGLFLAHRERVSLTRLEEKAEEEEKQAETHLEARPSATPSAAPEKWLQ